MTILKESLILFIMLCLFGPALGWAQIGPVGKEAVGANPTSSVAPAPDEAGSSHSKIDWLRENVTLSTGLKIWVVQWQAPYFFRDGVGQTNATAPMLGPTATLSMN